MASPTDLLAVLICTVSPALSALLLVAMQLLENAIVRLLGGDESGKTAKNNNAPSSSLLRRRVKAILGAGLQVASAGILAKMATLLVGELLELVEEAAPKEGGHGGEEHMATMASIAGGIVFSIVLVYMTRDGDEGGASSGKDVAEGKGKAESSSSSSRGVILAMLIHTCAEGLAAGLVMSGGDKGSSESEEGGGESISSMLDISSAYFVSLILHNVSEGLVVATAVRAEVEEENAKAIASNKKRNGRNWFWPTLLKTTFSHLGQPLGLLAVLYASSIGLDGLAEMPRLVAFIQGVSFGSICAAILLEALPEVFEALGDLAGTFKKAQPSASAKKQKKE